MTRRPWYVIAGLVLCWLTTISTTLLIAYEVVFGTFVFQNVTPLAIIGGISVICAIALDINT